MELHSDEILPPEVVQNRSSVTVSGAVRGTNNYPCFFGRMNLSARTFIGFDRAIPSQFPFRN
jgi:hypothetical protein